MRSMFCEFYEFATIWLGEKNDKKDMLKQITVP